MEIIFVTRVIRSSSRHSAFNPQSMRKNIYSSSWSIARFVPPWRWIIPAKCWIKDQLLLNIVLQTSNKTCYTIILCLLQVVARSQLMEIMGVVRVRPLPLVTTLVLHVQLPQIIRWEKPLLKKPLHLRPRLHRTPEVNFSIDLALVPPRRSLALQPQCNKLSFNFLFSRMSMHLKNRSTSLIHS